MSLPKPLASAECHNLTFGPSLLCTGLIIIIMYITQISTCSLQVIATIIISRRTYRIQKCDKVKTFLLSDSFQLLRYKVLPACSAHDHICHCPKSANCSILFSLGDGTWHRQMQQLTSRSEQQAVSVLVPLNLSLENATQQCSAIMNSKFWPENNYKTHQDIVYNYIVKISIFLIYHKKFE